MRPAPFPPLIPLLAALALLAGGCERDGEQAEVDHAAQGAEGFFEPRPGESWTYRVQREIPLELELAPDDLARRPQRTESGHLITFDRIRTCRGPRPIEPLSRPLTAMDLLESGKLLGQELYDIGPTGVFFRGWIPEGAKDSTGLLAEGVKLATRGLLAGQSWTSAGADPNRRFLFRVIEVTGLKVPAGFFEAARIQIINDYEGHGLKRTIWFAPKIGIVKEESVYYDPQRTTARETSVLVHYSVPTAGSGTGESPAPTPPQPDGDPAPPPLDPTPATTGTDPSPEHFPEGDPAPGESPAAESDGDPNGEPESQSDPDSGPDSDSEARDKAADPAGQ